MTIGNRFFRSRGGQVTFDRLLLLKRSGGGIGTGGIPSCGYIVCFEQYTRDKGKRERYFSGRGWFGFGVAYGRRRGFAPGGEITGGISGFPRVCGGIFGTGDADETKQGAEDAKLRNHGDLLFFLVPKSSVAYSRAGAVG